MVATRSTYALALALALGMLVGLGSYTFAYARGYSYLLDDPETCVNCHVMRDNYNSWVASPHRTVPCNGCHTPHLLVDKYLVKAQNGFAHSFAFTFEDPQVVRIKSHSLEVVEENCVECHIDAVATTFLAASESRRCTTCHPGMGHVL